MKLWRVWSGAAQTDEEKTIEEYRRWAEWLGIYDELARVHEREQLK